MSIRIDKWRHIDVLLVFLNLNIALCRRQLLVIFFGKDDNITFILAKVRSYGPLDPLCLLYLPFERRS